MRVKAASRAPSPHLSIGGPRASLVPVEPFYCGCSPSPLHFYLFHGLGYPFIRGYAVCFSLQQLPIHYASPCPRFADPLPRPPPLVDEAPVSHAIVDKLVEFAHGCSSWLADDK